MIRLPCLLILCLSALMSSMPGSAHTDSAATITSLLVRKSERTLFLLQGNRAIGRYPIRLGFNPVGPKLHEGDGRTPEGIYRITHKNPVSRFHLSLGLSYPDRSDRARVRALGLHPEGDIFLHGEDPNRPGLEGDWTHGCIAVSNSEIEEIYRLVRVGTPIRIEP